MNRRSALGVLVILIVALFMLRRVLFSSGVIAYDDLVPFPYLHQLWDFLTKDWNDYYQWPDIRSIYSSLGLFLRYGPLVPFSLLLVSVLAGVGVFSFTRRLQRSAGIDSQLELAGPIAAGLLYMILLFSSKAHQVYSLFLGAALLPWMFLAFENGLLGGGRRTVGWSVLAALLLVLNPSVHLVLIGYVALTAIALMTLWTGEKRLALQSWLIVTLGLIVYGLWIVLPGRITEAMATVPVTFQLLQAWSGRYVERLLLPVGLSLPETHAGGGTYVFAPQLFSRYPVMTSLFAIYPLMAIVGLWLLRRRAAALKIGLLWLGSVFMGVGVRYSLSGYGLLLAVAGSDGPWAAPTAAVLGVLRNPNRWLLLAALCLTTLAGLGLTALWERLRRYTARARAWPVGILAVSALLVPFTLHPAFRPVFSGDLGGVLRPAPLPESYREALRIVDGDKTLYLPLMGARPLRWNGSKKTTDEALALLHGGPSMEGVTGAPLVNQLYVGYLYFELLYRGKTATVGRYLAAAGIRYLFFHDDVENPLLPEEFSRVLSALQAQEDLELIYHRGDVYLFENRSWAESLLPLDGLIAFDGRLDELSELLTAGIDVRHWGLVHVGEGELTWQTFQDLAERLGPRLIVYAPAGKEDFLLSLLAGEVGSVAYPKPAWGEETLSWRDSRWLNITTAYFERFAELYGRFGVEGARAYRVIASAESGASASFELRIPETNTYRVFLRAFSPSGARIAVDVDGLYQTEISLAPSPHYAFTEVDRLFLREGVHRIEIRTRSGTPIVVNLFYALPQDKFKELQEGFQHRLSLVSYVRDLEEAVRHARSLEGAAGRSQAFDLYGYYDQRFWNRRRLATPLGSVPPLRSWLVGSLYALPQPLPKTEVSVR